MKKSTEVLKDLVDELKSEKQNGKSKIKIGKKNHDVNERDIEELETIVNMIGLFESIGKLIKSATNR